MTEEQNPTTLRQSSHSEIGLNTNEEERMEEIFISDIYAAKRIISNHIHHTPLDPNKSISQSLGYDVFFKLENMQKSGAYNVRGVMNRFSSLTESEKRKGVITASNGNHGLAVAYCGKHFNVPTTIVVPTFTNPRRIETMKRYGANVVFNGLTVQESENHAKQLSQEKRLCYIDSKNDVSIIAGNGTIGLEIIQDLTDVDVIVAPISTGCLLSGIGLIAKSLDPHIKIYGVQNEKGSAYYSKKNHVVCRSHQKEDNELTDVVNLISKQVFDLIENYVDDVFTVEQTYITKAMMLLMERCKIITEGTGAMALAGLLSGQIPVEKGSKVAVIITGGNVNLKMLSDVINLGLISSERSLNLEVIAPDSPASVNDLISLIAEQKAQLYDFQVKKNVAMGLCKIRFHIEVGDRSEKEQLSDVLKEKGYQFTFV